MEGCVGVRSIKLIHRRRWYRSHQWVRCLCMCRRQGQVFFVGAKVWGLKEQYPWRVSYAPAALIYVCMYMCVYACSFFAAMRFQAPCSSCSGRRLIAVVQWHRNLSSRLLLCALLLPIYNWAFIYAANASARPLLRLSPCVCACMCYTQSKIFQSRFSCTLCCFLNEHLCKIDARLNQLQFGDKFIGFHALFTIY